jgi:hypothetical protein
MFVNHDYLKSMLSYFLVIAGILNILYTFPKLLQVTNDLRLDFETNCSESAVFFPFFILYRSKVNQNIDIVLAVLSQL